MNYRNGFARNALIMDWLLLQKIDANKDKPIKVQPSLENDSVN